MMITTACPASHSLFHVEFYLILKKVLKINTDILLVIPITFKGCELLKICI